MLLQTWYNLSDMAVEDMVNDTLSANAFCGLRVEDAVSDHSTLSRFRSELSEKRAMNRLLKQLNSQLERLGIEVRKGGGTIDASLSPPRRISRMARRPTCRPVSLITLPLNRPSQG